MLFELKCLTFSCTVVGIYGVLFCSVLNFDDCSIYLVSLFALKDLGISRISKNLTEIASSAKKKLVNLFFFFWFLSAKNQDLIWLIFPSCPVQRHVPKQKTKKTNVEVEPRRSSRVRNPVRSYREDVSNIVFQTTINP